MASIQKNFAYQSLYKSPYFVSTYDRQATLDPEQMKALDDRSGEHPAYIPLATNPVSGKRTIINLDVEADEGFVDIDELLSDMQQKNIASSGTAEEVNVGSANGSALAFIQSSQGSTQDLDTASIKNYMSAESETDHQNLEIELTATNEADSPHNTSGETADCDTFDSGIIPTSDPVVIDCQDEDSAKIRSTKRSDSVSSAVPSKKFASDCNTSVSELLASQHGSAQSSQPGTTVVSLYQSDSTNKHLTRHYCKQDNNKNDRCRRSCSTTPTSPASPGSSASTAFRNNEFECIQPGTRPKTLANGRVILNLDQEISDDGGTDNSSDEDYCDRRDAIPLRIEDPSHSQKRIKRTRERGHNNIEASSTHSLNVSNQTIIATSSGSVQESEQIPIHGCLTLKTIGSKIVYCLTFSQELLPEVGGVSQKQGIAGSDSSSSITGDLDQLPVREGAMSGTIRKSRFTPYDDNLLRQLKQKGLSWDEISDHFPTRSKGTLQVHYSTKLKDHSDKSRKRK